MVGDSFGTPGSIEIYHFRSADGNKGGIVIPVENTAYNLELRIKEFQRIMLEKQTGTIVFVDSETFPPKTGSDTLLQFAIYGECQRG